MSAQQEEERLPEANIAEHLRWKGCVGDAALRGSDQGEPPERFPHQKQYPAIY